MEFYGFQQYLLQDISNIQIVLLMFICLESLDMFMPFYVFIIYTSYSLLNLYFI